MAKYHSSILGTISGKVGDVVCVRGKKGNFIKVYSKANFPQSSEAAIQQALTGNYKNVSARTINQNYVIFPHLSYIASNKHKFLIYPIWKALADKKKLTPNDFFLQYNLPSFKASIPDQKKLCSSDNLPAIGKIYISNGNLESTPIIKIYYSPKTGILSVLWNSKTYSNGSADDFAFIAAIYYFMSPDFWKSKAPASELIKILPDSIEPLAKRKDGFAQVKISKSLNPEYLTVFLFFKNKKGEYSRSSSAKIN